MNKQHSTCTLQVCEQKRKKFSHLSEKSLCLQMQACEACENGIFKENAIIRTTYHLICNTWAENHNKVVGRVL